MSADTRGRVSLQRQSKVVSVGAILAVARKPSQSAYSAATELWYACHRQAYRYRFASLPPKGEPRGRMWASADTMAILSVFHKFFWRKLEKTCRSPSRVFPIPTFSPKNKKLWARNAVSVTRFMRYLWMHNGRINTPKPGVKNGQIRDIAVEKPNFSTISTGLSTGYPYRITGIFIQIS